MAGQLDVQRLIECCLAVVRLGDTDQLGWWRSHSVDDTAEYVLGEAFASTWLATGLEMAMESARIRHDTALERQPGARPAVHLFSGYLPFHQLAKSWLIERKLERDCEPLNWTRTSTLADLRIRLGEPSTVQRRGAGLYLGDITRCDLDTETSQREIFWKLTRAYVSLEQEFAAPYVDLLD